MPSEYRNNIQAIMKRLDKAYEEAVQEIAEGVLATASEAISMDAIDTGTLLKSGEIRKPQLFRRQVAWTSEYAPYVEHGTRPHWPPKDPIRAWVKRNLRVLPPAVKLPSSYVFKPKTREGTRRPMEAEVERVTYLIQRKIAMRGTAPVRFAKRGERWAVQNGDRILEAAINRRLKPFAGGGD